MEIIEPSSEDLNYKIVAELFKKSIEKYGGQWRRVVTHSMHPFISIGDWIWIEAISDYRIKAGDIVVFYRNNEFIVHRILKVNRNQGYLIEKGDLSEVSDTIAIEYVVGKVTKIRKGDKIIDLISPRNRIKNKFMTVYSLSHLFWYKYINDVRIKIAKSTPHLLKTPIRFILLNLRKVIYPENLFNKIQWYDIIEDIRIGEQTLSATIAPRSNDFGKIVKKIVEKSINNPVLCLYMNGITETLRSYLTTIDFIVILMNETGVVIDIIDGNNANLNISINEIKFVLLINKAFHDKINIKPGDIMHFEGVT